MTKRRLSPMSAISVRLMNRPASIGQPLALTECRVLDLHDHGVVPGEPGELVA